MFITNLLADLLIWVFYQMSDKSVPLQVLKGQGYPPMPEKPKHYTEELRWRIYNNLVGKRAGAYIATCVFVPCAVLALVFLVIGAGDVFSFNRGGFGMTSFMRGMF